ncbi:MAG: IS66 family transposase [Ktedonobacterales bacterium]
MVTDEAYAALQGENAALREQLARALQRIAELEVKKSPPLPFVKANVVGRAEPRPPRRKRRAEQNAARRREQATVVVLHPVTLCPDCASRLGGVHVGRRRQVVDLPPPPAVVVTEHQLQRGWCSACARWQEASLDMHGLALGQGRLGVGIASLVAHLRTGLRLPIRTIQRYLADLHGLRVSVGALVELLHRVAQQGQPRVRAIRDAARTREVVHADETGWREDGHNGYVWLLATAEGERYVEYHRSRAGSVANALLGEGFGGVLVSDFYGGYNDTAGGRHQRCWVHLLRDLRALAEAHAAGTAVVDLEVQTWTAAVRTLWQQVRTAVATSPPPPVAQRERLAQRLRLDVQALGAQFVAAPDHPCRALAWRLWHFQHELLTCVAQPGVPPDNNAAERAIRPLVVARKISGGTRSSRGSATRMALSSLAATWTAQGRNPLAEFRRLLQTPLPQV